MTEKNIWKEEEILEAYSKEVSKVDAEYYEKLGRILNEREATIDKLRLKYGVTVKRDGSKD